MSGLIAFLEPAVNIAKTVVGIGGLIMVHELGHFLVGRWCGVRAEAFSIGMGPVILKWKPGPTEYRLSAIPIGGYVKFLGENPGEEGALEPDSFPAATYPRRVAIMLAGVATNVVVAAVLFVLTFSMGVEQLSPVVGATAVGSPAWVAGLEPGDRILSINGNRILDFGDVQQDTMFAEVVEVVVEREGKTLEPIRIPTMLTASGLRMIGVSPALLPGGVLAVREDGPAWKAGLRANDVVRRVDGEAVTTVDEAVVIHGAASVDAGATTWEVERDGETLTFDLPVTVAWKFGVQSDARAVSAVRRGGAAERAGLKAGDEPLRVGDTGTPTVLLARRAILDPQTRGPLVVRRGGKEVSVPLPTASSDSLDRSEFVASFAYASGKSTLVSPLLPEDGPSAARDAGMPAGSTVLTIDGDPLHDEDTDDGKTGSWTTMLKYVQRAGDRDGAARVRWRGPDGVESQAQLQLARVSDVVGLGLGPMARTELLREEDVMAAAALGLDRTHRWVTRIMNTLGSILGGGVSPRKLAGPIQIARMSYKTAESSTSEFFLFLGMISMNLAVLNLLPIPLLDGGQLAVMTVEKVYGRPLPERVMEGIQWAGLVLLLGLMVFVIGNDIVNLVS